MVLLLAADEVELFRPGEPDATGWREPAGERAYWSGAGNLQLNQGFSDPRGTDRGGHGPHDPAASQRGTLYLPPGVEVAEGCSARVRGQLYVLSQVRLVADPQGNGDLDCQAATVSGRADG